nr:response regulator [Lachnospiraceae bacterium]
FAPAIYLNSVQRGRYQISMSVIMIISSINAVLWPMLHFCGILSFFVVRIPVNIALVGICGYVIILLIVDAARGNAGSYRYTFIGFFGFLICCILELLLLIVITTLEEPIPMVIGLGVLLAFVVMQQVDDLRKINLEKQHAIDISEAKTRFLASMSHEIRTPINAILGMNEMILRENSDHVITDYARNIKTSGKMLLMLVNDVLDFSKIEAGKLEINEARFLMSDMLYDVISLVKERADEKRLALETEITAEVPNELLSDEFRIRQILVNLINNAVKYTEKGTVTLKIGGYFLPDETFMLDLRVKDTGKGIKKEEQANLFEAFSRADVKSNVNIEGTGLGLAIVKSIVDSMNGEVGVESEYGVGSEFYVKLPVKAVSKELLPEDYMENRSTYEAAVDQCLFTAPDAKILAVDDNQSNLTIVKLFLKRTGIVPDLCNNGNTAVEMSRKTKYDLILLDHMMPDPDGIKTLHLIRNDEKTLNKDTKAVVLTANAVAGSRQMYMDEGFDDYLTKPLDSNVLEQTVMKMLPKDKVMLASKTKAEETTEKRKAFWMSESSETTIKTTHITKTEEMNFDGIMEFDASMEFVPQESASEEYGSEIQNGPDNNDTRSAAVNKSEKPSALKEKLTSIEGLDYEKALRYSAGDEGFLTRIVNDIASEGIKRTERMKKSLAEDDLKSYQIEAHAAKSNMATLGLTEFSERAKKHEFAAKENNITFIREDCEDFINTYLQLCQRLL